MRKRKSIFLATLALLVVLLFPLSVAAAGSVFPELIPLPLGFRPEGIAVGKGHTFYTGSLGNGAIYRGDLRTGLGELIHPGQDGRMAVGMSYDKRSGNLFVAGGLTGQVYVFDGDSGAELVTYDLAPPGASFLNDVIVTKDAAYVTNSFDNVFYQLLLGPAGEIPLPAPYMTHTLFGDFVQVPGPFVFNSNGIEASPDGKSLLIVNSARGELYRVDPDTGYAGLIDLGGASLSFGDGLLLHGPKLFVVRNQLNQIDVIKLNRDWSSGMVMYTITNPNFRVPTTIAAFGKALYAVNARFDVTPAPDTEYEILRLELTR
jgi:outer membrane protein assembly factor BamB